MNVNFRLAWLSPKTILIAIFFSASFTALSSEHQLVVTELNEPPKDQSDKIAEDMEYLLNGIKNGFPDGFDLNALANQNGKDHPGAFATYPLMITDVIPFNWNRFSAVPHVAIIDELERAGFGRGYRTEDLTTIFNIKVVTYDNQLTLPSNAVLVGDLVSTSKSFRFRIPMILKNGQSFYIEDPQGLARELIYRISQISPEQNKWGPTPEFTMRKLEGIPINADTVKNMRSFGIEVAILFRFGNTSVLSEFQWGGRHEKIPLSYPNLPFLAAS